MTPEDAAKMFGTELVEEYVVSPFYMILKVKKNNEDLILKKNVTVSDYTCASNEINALNALKDLNFVPKLYDFIEDIEFTYYLKQYVGEMTLKEHIITNKSLFRKNRRSLKKQMLEKINEVHSRGFSRFDLERRNISITPKSQELFIFDLDAVVSKNNYLFSEGKSRDLKDIKKSFAYFGFRSNY